MLGLGGVGAVDEASITGESIPAEKTDGDAVYAGTVATAGLLQVRARGVGADTTLARIIHRVEAAQEARARTQRFMDRFSRWYTPAIMVLAFATGLITRDVPLALTLLVIGCPGALVISIPVAIVAGIGRGAKDGVLIKGGEFLERSAKVDAVAVDKTGTLTRGRPALAQVTAFGGTTEQEALALAAAVEAGSEHPIAAAITAGARDRGLDIPTARDARALPGAGMEAVVDGRAMHIGRPSDADRTDPQVGAAVAGAEANGSTAVVLREDTRPLAVLAVADQLRPDAHSTIAELRELGIERVLMLTGDNATVAKTTAHALGLDDYRAELLPEDKSAAVRELRERYGVIAMVGDGVNDAPALANADLAIAMGAAGTDVALETSDVALMADELDRLPAAIRLSRRARNNIKINIALSLAVVAILIIAALAGWMTLTTGLLLNEGSAALIILNGLRMMLPGRGETRQKRTA